MFTRFRGNASRFKAHSPRNRRMSLTQCVTHPWLTRTSYQFTGRHVCNTSSLQKQKRHCFLAAKLARKTRKTNRPENAGYDLLTKINKKEQFKTQVNLTLPNIQLLMVPQTEAAKIRQRPHPSPTAQINNKATNLQSYFLNRCTPVDGFHGGNLYPGTPAGRRNK